MSLDAWHGPARALAGRIAEFVDCDGTSEAFEGLAVAIARHQIATQPALAALTDGPVTRLADVPVVPVALFKDLTLGPPDGAVTFYTSGTTDGRPGVARLRSTALYDRGAIRHARRFLGPDGAPTRGVHLLEDPARAPHSSLSHMAVRLCPLGVAWAVVDGRLDRATIERALDACDGPVFVAATAFAMAEWLEGPVPSLPSDSLVMVTGGFKGRIRTIDADRLVAVAAERLRCRIVLEYGMTELSSQLWAWPGQAYAPPPWLRVVAVDPATGAEVPDGTPGQLRFYDLCNLDTAVAIETLDAGTIRDGRVTLHGRLAGAPRRGCSLSLDPT